VEQKTLLDISASTYEWTARVFTVLKRILRVNVALHHSEGQLASGEIFLFNHFARFETFIPQYLIYQETGALCRSIASSEFFVEGDVLSNYLLSVGAVPNNHPSLLACLAAEILRDRKVIIFPEGGMVKDRRVLDDAGRYSVYSRMARQRRKHHSGAAVLALGVEAFKIAIRQARRAGNRRRIEAWAEALGLDSVQALLSAVRRPTLIIPANITFHPIRVSDNLLRKGAELVSRGLSRRLSEELLIEGNILLKDTDMDIRLGDPVQPAQFWSWWERALINRMGQRLDSLDQFFDLSPASRQWDQRFMVRCMRRKALQVRDAYMHRMYKSVTVNLSHLASCIIMQCINQNQMQIDQTLFHRILYLSVKNVQKGPSIHLHQGLKNPEVYGSLIDDHCADLDKFLEMAASTALVERGREHYRFLPKLCEQHDFDEIRLENFIAVYTNEVEPIPGVLRAIRRAMAEGPALDDRALMKLRFDDELIAYRWDKQNFSEPRYVEINYQETATESAEPFFLMPGQAKNLGVVLVHGFLASPAEVRAFGYKLSALGFTVVGVRLKGHGTSPWDLRERSWQDWLASVRRGYTIMAAHAEHVALVGFSTGGALSLMLAADQPDKLAGVAAVAVPIRFRNRNMMFVPLMHGANRMARWMWSSQGIMPFRLNNSEHPHINYRNMPIRGLYELQRLVEAFELRLPDVHCPVILIQSTEDPVVDPKSAEIVHDKLGSQQKSLAMIPAQRHGILYEDIGNTHGTIISFLTALTPAPAPSRVRGQNSLSRDKLVRGSA
jgi:Esterase/lipase